MAIWADMEGGPELAAGISPRARTVAFHDGVPAIATIDSWPHTEHITAAPPPAVSGSLEAQ